MSGEQLPLIIRKGIRDAEPKVKAAIDAIGLFVCLLLLFLTSVFLTKTKTPQKRSLESQE